MATVLARGIRLFRVRAVRRVEVDLAVDVREPSRYEQVARQRRDHDPGLAVEPPPPAFFDHEVVAFEDAEVAHPVVARAPDQARFFVGAVQKAGVGIKEAFRSAAERVGVGTVGAADEGEAWHVHVEGERVGPGVQQFDAAGLVGKAADVALLFERVEVLRDAVRGADAERVADVLERGRLALLTDVGADVLVDVVLALGEDGEGHRGEGMCGEKVRRGETIFTSAKGEN